MNAVGILKIVKASDGLICVFMLPGGKVYAGEIGTKRSEAMFREWPHYWVGTYDRRATEKFIDEDLGAWYEQHKAA